MVCLGGNPPRKTRRRLPPPDDREGSAPSQASAACDIARGDESMIPFIMATERIAGFEHLVGRWDEAQHRSALADGRHLYFISTSSPGTAPSRSASSSCAIG